MWTLLGWDGCEESWTPLAVGTHEEMKEKLVEVLNEQVQDPEIGRKFKIRSFEDKESWNN